MVWSAWGRYSAPSRARSSSPSLTRCTTHPLVGPNPRLVTHGPRECVPAAPVSTETQRETERVVSRPAPAHLTHVRPPVAQGAEERRQVARHGRPRPIHTAEPRDPPLGELLDHVLLAQRQEQRQQHSAHRASPPPGRGAPRLGSSPAPRTQAPRPCVPTTTARARGAREAPVRSCAS